MEMRSISTTNRCRNGTMVYPDWVCSQLYHMLIDIEKEDQIGQDLI